MGWWIVLPPPTEHSLLLQPSMDVILDLYLNMIGIVTDLIFIFRKCYSDSSGFIKLHFLSVNVRYELLTTCKLLTMNLCTWHTVEIHYENRELKCFWLCCRNAVSAYLHMLMEQNCIAFPVPTIFIVDASAVGFGQKQLARSANIISLEVRHWSEPSWK